MPAYQNATIQILNETAFTYLSRGDILSAFWKTMIDQWGVFIYVIIIFTTDVVILNKSKSASMAVIANILMLTLFQSFIIEVVHRIMFIATAIVITIVIWTIYSKVENV